MNSSYSVSPSSLQGMITEFKRGREIVKNILDTGGEGWAKLFEPSDFFIKYSHYISCNIIGDAEDGGATLRGWLGFVESRIRKLPSYLGNDETLASIQLFPTVYRLSKTPQTYTYFIGFNLNLNKLGNKKMIRLDDGVARFWSNDLRKYSGSQNDSLDFTVDYFRGGYLPREVFVSVGGVERAKGLRAEYAEAVRLKRHAVGADGSAAAPSTATRESLLNGKADGNMSSSKALGESSTTGDNGEGSVLRTLGKRKLSLGEGDLETEGFLEAIEALPKLRPPTKHWKKAHDTYRVPIVTAWNLLESTNK